MKDPAFLFYYQDFLVGTDDMDLQTVGAYIRCLCHQASKGALTEKHMLKICETYVIHNEIIKKFKTDDNGQTFYNERLKNETEKRRKYSQSRANNRKGSKINTTDSDNICKTYEKHMENEDINENEIEKGKGGVGEKPIITLPFSEQFTELWQHWKDYRKKEHRYRFASIQSEQAAINNLIKLSDGNEKTAREIVIQSMANGWKGFFELKTNNTNGKSSNHQQTWAERSQSIDKAIDALYA
jgi:hypothetical protein